MHAPRSQNFLGISLVEMLIAVSTLGILAAAGIAMVSSGAIQGAREAKFEQELKVLNSAVLAYAASGGDLSEVRDAGAVLAKLKTVASPEQRERIPGFSGRFLDNGTVFAIQTKEEARKNSPRFHWNNETKRFEISRSGAPGIVFAKDSSSGGADIGTEAHEHRTLPLAYASEGNWIWDYVEIPVPVPPGATEFTLADSVESSLPPPPPLPSAPVRLDALAPPSITPGGGRFPRHEFDLGLTLNDPNPPGAANLFYSLNYGDWMPYAGSPISVPADTVVKAQAIPNDRASWEPSPVEQQAYEAFFAMLLPPEIEFDEPFFLKSKSRDVTSIVVTLADTNDVGLAELVYQIVPTPRGPGPRTDFQPYLGPFSVHVSDYPEGFGVRAFARAVAPGYEDSRVASRFATERTDLFGGHLDLDTSTFIAAVGSGKTDAHSHDILKSVGGNTLDFFGLPESKQIEIHEAVTDPSQRFRILVVNGNLSPGMNLVLDFDFGGVSNTLDIPVDRYGSFSDGELDVFTLGGAPGTARLRGLRLVMAQDVLTEAGIIPTNTGDVVGNVLGRDSEWRNGALTLQAVRVNSDGSPGYSLDPSRSNGGPGVATSGLLWEAAVFWHWDGDSYHREKNTFQPRNPNSIKMFLRN